ncbi:MAG: AAA family ATPase [bacterium]|nr:AAA family ATPase [bacterium]
MTIERPPRVLALVGMPGAGKSLCAAHLERLGYFQFRFGGIVVEEVQRRGLAITPEHERLVREEFRAHEGMDAIAKRALPILKTALATRQTIVIDGLYSFSEYKTLRRDLSDDLQVIAVVCAREKRYRRLAERAERPLTRAEAEERDVREIEHIEKGGPIAMADYTLLNDDTPEALIAGLNGLLDRLGVRI